MDFGALCSCFFRLVGLPSFQSAVHGSPLPQPEMQSAARKPMQSEGRGGRSPRCHLDVKDDELRHLLASERPATWLPDMMKHLLMLMYGDERSRDPRDVPPVRDVYVRVYPFEGIGHTVGNRVSVSSTYLSGIALEGRVDEMEGVVCHELVHVFQYNGQSTAPGGFIEGVADYYRLHMGLAPNHWHRRPVKRWDEGYDATAYFFDYLARKYNRDAVRCMNLYLREQMWCEREVFIQVCDTDIDELVWKYNATFA